MVIAGSGCDLRPLTGAGEHCGLLAQPVGGVLRLSSRRSVVRVSVDSDGTFEKRIPEGRYRIRIVRAQRGSERLKASELALSSRSVTVGAKEEPILLLVRHRSRPLKDGPGIGY